MIPFRYMVMKTWYNLINKNIRLEYWEGFTWITRKMMILITKRKLKNF